MTRKEIEALKGAASRARSAVSSLSSMLSPLSSGPANAELSILSDFTRSVENTLSAAADVIEARPQG